MNNGSDYNFVNNIDFVNLYNLRSHMNVQVNNNTNNQSYFFNNRGY